MPNRILRDWTDSEPVNDLEPSAEVFFTRLIMKADDYGRFYGNPMLLKAALYPLRLNSVREADISRWMAECQKAGLIVLYTVNAKAYVAIRNFDQRLRVKKEKYPAPPTDGSQPPAARPSNDGHVSDKCPPDDGQMTGTCRRESESETNPKRSGSEGNGAGAPEPTPPPKISPQPGKPNVTLDLQPFAPLQTPEFEAVWAEWIGYKLTRKESDPTENYLPNVRRVNLDFLARQGVAKAIATVRLSLNRGAKNLILDATPEQLAPFLPRKSAKVDEPKRSETDVAVMALVKAVSERRLEDAAKLKKTASAAILNAAFSLLDVEGKNILSRLGKEKG